MEAYATSPRWRLCERARNVTQIGGEHRCPPPSLYPGSATLATPEPQLKQSLRMRFRMSPRMTLNESQIGLRLEEFETPSDQDSLGLTRPIGGFVFESSLIYRTADFYIFHMTYGPKL